MTNAITPVSLAERALAEVKTPEESKKVEAMAAAATAWAKEQDDFELVVRAGRVYILARRKTTELSIPYAPENGGDRRSIEFQSNDIVTLKDFNFTRMQWSRRMKELSISAEDIDAYIDECIETQVEPTKFGLLRFALQIIGDPTGNEWWTPAEYIESARRVLGEIDLDPASCAEANRTVKAKKIYTEADSGLGHEWAGRATPDEARRVHCERVLKLAVAMLNDPGEPCPVCGHYQIWGEGQYHTRCANVAVAGIVGTKSRGGMQINVFARDGYRCRRCGAEGADVDLTIDHIVPRSRGGSDHPDNLQTLCQPCNSKKSNKVAA